MLLPRHTGRTILAHAGLRRKLKEPSSAGQSAASERHRMKGQNRASFIPSVCQNAHVHVKQNTIYEHPSKPRVSALFCVRNRN